MALLLVTDHREWFDVPAWSVAVILVGLLALVAGFALYRGESARRRPG
jgi:hypothetical protein